MNNRAVSVKLQKHWKGSKITGQYFDMDVLTAT